ncbi:alternative ribosome rescue aminoacyl-tRNA hydrolase ArfB [Polaribacter sp. Z022]|uniref:alternative ribosome rescue aminoacyl-tRNA hydrolase ArfB n=1 Tax=Polaribacter sp. Z022 TaxID=2927125 RepID=UPI002021669F|nr:alternative ribosome rescue aminoacyl-tRNA hydrolase ArfB [Polaribacter sp. Z022]MCL7752244.1 aminoacyl-tRNA hydrolase [Polaribacter sp. Z022]
MNKSQIIKELNFKAIRSSGAGGQHVNKVSSKVELTFDFENSDSLSENEKNILRIKLHSKLTKEKNLILFCDETRSQHRNKELVIKRFLELLRTNLIRNKKRKPTKPTKASIKRKAENKKRTSDKKSLRKKPKLD